jgi:DNA-binding XRE family transcriptional regulator
MPRKLSETRIGEVEAGTGLTLHVVWWTGDSDDIDLAETLDHPCFARIRSDRQYFKQVKIGEFGAYVFWNDDTDISGEYLANLAKNRSARMFKSWMAANGLTYDQAAKALGVARRTIGKYTGAEVKIPKAIKLACKAISHGLAA